MHANVSLIHTFHGPYHLLLAQIATHQVLPVSDVFIASYIAMCCYIASNIATVVTYIARQMC